MLINITGAGDKRTLTVTDETGVVFEAKGVTLKEAQDMGRTGLREGWDTLKAKK